MYKNNWVWYELLNLKTYRNWFNCPILVWSEEERCKNIFSHSLKQILRFLAKINISLNFTKKQDFYIYDMSMKL